MEESQFAPRMGPFATTKRRIDLTKRAAPWSEAPDGNMWFTDFFEFDRYIMLRGTISFYQLDHDAEPSGIALGSDGALWFTDSVSMRSVV